MTAIRRAIRRYIHKGRHRAEMAADPWAPFPLYYELAPVCGGGSGA